jgi:hypothetical protein
MWSRFHLAGMNPRQLWAIPTWIAILSLLSLVITVPQNLWPISVGVAGLALLILLISLFIAFPYKLWEKDAPLRKLRDEQIGNEQDWIYLIIEGINLGRIEAYSAREIQIQFKIISALVYDLQLCGMCVTLRLGGYTPEEPLLTIRPVPTLLRGRPYEPGTKRITVMDDGLFDRICSIRNGIPMEKRLDIEIQLNPNEKPRLLWRNF